MKKALICGISGQDGSYLAKFLLDRGYEVCGTSRDAQMSSFRNLVRLGIRDRVKLESMTLTDFRSVLQVLDKAQPYEVYNLGGQSSVGLSFNQPVETLDSIATGTLNLLEAIRFIGAPIKLYNAGSSECFGDTGGEPADENTPFRPRSPYGVAKAAAFWEVANYREAYGLFACSGILYNHESPLRPERFVTQKTVAAACRIAQGSPERLYLGNTSIQRDWGWAPEYIQGMYRILQQDAAEDYIIATGKTYKLQDFVATVFEYLGLNWQDHVTTDESLYRPTDISIGRGNPNKAKEKMGWEARYDMHDVARMMVDARLNSEPTSA
ncbi:GDP-mannose 4,6 dehydratase [Leptolyngbya valderiana BDU 20041]|uniref:GDP-mannose 4,6-dehydratase n=1 Tax=Baaleninema simplex TaxID=2862350 RepID=UPI0003628CC7|nr:GDP-mannose 4,6-dehydratase [Baaleninema simplex]MDC0834597.1 GDP-mannose 4,6-dehydratase [Geitlerinema sp. CS-897]OAB55548.1 GDP-mannose 4,6 dehydratase [Leptolyngbya valderiana BDU 20041]PPT07958.1 GDP-mannose 46-dehydratase [Geitlerinema sp. FC II]